jgi:hypothetical protein
LTITHPNPADFSTITFELLKMKSWHVRGKTQLYIYEIVILVDSLGGSQGLPTLVYVSYNNLLSGCDKKVTLGANHGKEEANCV